LNSDIINECINVIVSYLFDFIGDKNIISVILTGSVARNQATYRYVKGKLALESDLDLVVVVKYVAIIKSFILIKCLSKKVTSDLVKRGLIVSHVSFSVTTEKALLHSGPSIFYQDLSVNGKVIFGKDIRSSFRSYKINKIPIQDLYRLLFNRMVESLEALVLSGALEGKLDEYSFDLIFKSLRKMNFALIQVMLIKEGILIFNISEIETAYAYQLKNQQVLDHLLKSHNELVATSKSSKNEYSILIIERYWSRIIDHFNLTMKLLYRIDDSSTSPLSSNISSNLIEKILFEHERLGDRLKTSLMIFLQYFKISNAREVVEAIIFVLRFGSDHIYFVLYDVFLSSQSILKEEVDKEDKTNYQKKQQQQQYDSTNNNNPKSHIIYTKKNWLKLYIKYLYIWKFKTGG
jgi:hypothetical protein